ncbi:hypothetical protein [Rheinheimera salexigens]|uniref:Uncharacterized protein n=1 Tax=Rheinheimera salexigens TaxID=1628148 RepID=A0A1E7Q2X6_9GAMM|nr:hypothetical protein [Rheinheimera salexigens]OEY68525.1 hypothetical protein BI198_02275 [Rheinheimera salexigens]
MTDNTDDLITIDNQADDPLAAIKAMRLAQLAVCRLKTAEEMQAMAEQSTMDEDDINTDENKS